MCCRCAVSTRRCAFSPSRASRSGSIQIQSNTICTISYKKYTLTGEIDICSNNKHKVLCTHKVQRSVEQKKRTSKRIYNLRIWSFDRTSRGRLRRSVLSAHRCVAGRRASTFYIYRESLLHARVEVLHENRVFLRSECCTTGTDSFLLPFCTLERAAPSRLYSAAFEYHIRELLIRTDDNYPLSLSAASELANSFQIDGHFQRFCTTLASWTPSSIPDPMLLLMAFCSTALMDEVLYRNIWSTSYATKFTITEFDSDSLRLWL